MTSAYLLTEPRPLWKALADTGREMTLDRAFEIILELARENQIDYVDSAAQFREQGQALDLVTAYHILRIKGEMASEIVINSYRCPGCGLGDIEPIRSEEL